MFKKGQSGNPSGRPKGCLGKKTRNYMDFQMWFQTVKENMEKLIPKERIEVALRVIPMLMSKIQNLPSTPEQSLENAKAREEIMKAFESKIENAPHT